MLGSGSGDGGTAANRRRWARVPHSGAVLVVSPSEVRTYRARDLSAGGAYLFARTLPPIGAAVRVEFDLGRSRYFAVLATVVRAEPESPPLRPAGFAVRFDAEATVVAEIEAALASEG